ncbi:hypothetical protein [Microbacterium sp.]|uniref:hypothetical protein n=1 Tax=Microbacterium sp. TaxID=51671 RepID=UPI0028113B36|nr:hypothetical protein [Microbacterium sp.]
MWIALGVVVALLVGFPVSISLVNDGAARGIETRLLRLPLPDGTERIDSMAQAGKLVGNGNGMQYIAALLIRSDHGAARLQGFYDAQKGVADLSITVTPAEDLAALRNATGFLSDPGESGTFVVQAWGEGPGGIFEAFDIRGH